MNFKPHNYQKTAISFIKMHDRCALFLDMGLGKTVSTLTALNDLENDYKMAKVKTANRVLPSEGKSVPTPLMPRRNGKPELTAAYLRDFEKKKANLILPSRRKTANPILPNGKSNFTKTANRFSPFPCLVIAPKRVALTTWTDEVQKWDHLKHLDVVSAAGLPPAKRRKVLK